MDSKHFLYIVIFNSLVPWRRHLTYFSQMYGCQEGGEFPAARTTVLVVESGGGGGSYLDTIKNGELRS